MDREKLKEVSFSYSRLKSFHQCKYGWQRTYIDKDRGTGNAFASHGSWMHHLLEGYATGEKLPFLLLDEYIEGYAENVKEKFPYNKYVDFAESYFTKGKAYLENFDGFGDYKILAVEKEVRFTIGDYKFLGYIDLLLEDNEGNLVVMDHKSKSFKNATKKDIQDYFNQLVFYCIPIVDEYGKYPTKLILNAFQEQRYIEQDFDESKIEVMKKWALDTIEEIAVEEEFEANTKGKFMCDNLCNHRNGCPYKNLTNDK